MHAGRMQAGLVLALLGGVRRGHAEHDCVPVRGDIHLLMCGDPGLGKSQLLQARLRFLAECVLVVVREFVLHTPMKQACLCAGHDSVYALSLSIRLWQGA